jgi:hypothetical protein
MVKILWYYFAVQLLHTNLEHLFDLQIRVVDKVPPAMGFLNPRHKVLK